MKAFITGFLKELLKAILAMVLLVLISIGVMNWHFSSIESFCHEKVVGKTQQQITALAAENEFAVSPAKDPKSLIITNHSSPFFRVGCSIVFKDDIAIEATFLET